MTVIKSLGKIIAIFLLMIAAALIGANQHRMKAWPFRDGFIDRVLSSLSRDKERQKDMEKKTTYWVENLKKGGYILYFRHADREKWPEVEAFDLYEFASGTKDASETSFKRAVCLSDQGVEEAKLIGKVFQLAKIPTGRIVSSPSCRAKQTAVLAFGKYDAIDSSIQFSRHVIEARAKVSGDSLMKLLLNVEILPGTNTVISGHSVNLDRARGVDGADADSPGLQETGFYVLERKSGNKLALVFSFKSLHDLAHVAIDASFEPR